MSSTYTSFKVDYPIFAADFDPYNRGYLVIGGGGGENKSGVPNKIVCPPCWPPFLTRVQCTDILLIKNLLDITSRDRVHSVAELDLPRDQDSVQSLASLATQYGLITFAGINSSSSELRNGKNQHLRTFDVRYPPKKKARTDSGNEDRHGSGRIVCTGRNSLFSPPTGEERDVPYQRLLKLSPVKTRDAPTRRIGAAATGFAERNEIVLFDATTPSPSSNSLLTRIIPDEGAEAVDMDIQENSKEGAFQLAFCTDHAVYVYSFNYDFSKKKFKPLFDKPSRMLTSDKGRYRAIRWLSDKHLVLLKNLPAGKEGAELVTIYIDDPSDAAIVTETTSLPRAMKAGMGMDATLLDADPATGRRQIIVAVAGKDASIRIYTLDFNPALSDARHHVSPPRLYETARDVHAQGISNVLLSPFFPPTQPANSPKSVASGSSYLQLASTSLDGTVIVDTLALTSTPTSPSRTSQVAGKKKIPAVRWVLSHSWTEMLRSQWVRGAMAVFFAFFAIFLQYRMFAGKSGAAVGDATAPIGKLDTYPSAMEGQEMPPAGWANLPHEVKEKVEVAEEGAVAMSGDDAAMGGARSKRLVDLVKDRVHHADGAEPALKPVVVRPHEGGDVGDVAVTLHELHEEDVLRGEHGARKFDELSGEERERWKDRLVRAGRWSVEEGEVVLKGILFSEMAGVVGGAVRDALNH